MRRFLRSGLGRIVLATLVLVLAWQVWLRVQAGPKIPPDLDQFVSPRGTVDLVVTLRFPPERFHILMFQRFGRVSGTRDHSLEVRSVPARRVAEIARFYWVKQIAPLVEEGGP